MYPTNSSKNDKFSTAGNSTQLKTRIIKNSYLQCKRMASLHQKYKNQNIIRMTCKGTKMRFFHDITLMSTCRMEPRNAFTLVLDASWRKSVMKMENDIWYWLVWFVVVLAMDSEIQWWDIPFFRIFSSGPRGIEPPSTRQ